MENIVNMQVPSAVVGIMLIVALTLCLYKAQKHKQAEQQVTDENSVTKQETVEEIVTEDKHITPEILAVITAAVAATMNTRNTYKITTIKRIESDLSPSWSKLARQEQLQR